MNAKDQKAGGARSVLSRLQLGIEALYRVETRLDVDSFVIDDEQRRAAGVARAPREQLLIAQDGDELALALFVDEAALANLERNDPSRGLGEANFGDFCLAVEGVSHFVYVAFCASGARRVSALEMELQAEVDKFACCALVDRRLPALTRRLFDQVHFADDLDVGERDRYGTANQGARRYAEALHRRYLAHERREEMLAELRRFYRLDLDGKLGHIARMTS